MKRQIKRIISLLLLLAIAVSSVGIAAFAKEDDPGNKFVDIKDHWAYGAIIKCVDEGLFKGRTEDTFVPGDNMTRAEFAQMIYNYYKDSDVLVPSGEIEFSDVKSADWYYEAVTYCASSGAIKGTGDGRFEPKGLITRQDAVLLLMRIEIGEENIEKINAEEILIKLKEDGKEFSDISQISEYAKKAFIGAIGLIINGNPDGTLNPAGKILRAECAQLMYNYLFINNNPTEETPEQPTKEETPEQSPEQTSEQPSDEQTSENPTKEETQERTYEFVALGDSITRGYGLTSPETDCFMSTFAKREGNINSYNYAIDGLTSQGLVQNIKTYDVKNAIREADAVSITIGGNDMMEGIQEVLKKAYGLPDDSQLLVLLMKLISQPEIAAQYIETDEGKAIINKYMTDFEKNLDTILDTIYNLNDECIIAVQTVYNPIYDSENLLDFASYLDVFINEINRIIEERAGREVVVIDIYNLFMNYTGEDHITNINSYDIHPNQKGHDLISEEYSKIFG